MLDAMAAGQDDPKRLAEMARGKLRAKLPALRLALEGRVQEHHRFLLREWLDHEMHLQSQLGQIDGEIARRAIPYEETVARWKTIPGVDGSVSLSPAIGKLGWGMSRKQRECWQTQERQDAKRKSLAATSPVPSSLGSLAHEGNLCGRPIPTLRRQTGQEARHYRGRPQYPRDRVPHAPACLRLPGAGWRLLRPD